MRRKNYKLLLALFCGSFILSGGSKIFAQTALDLAGPGNYVETNYNLNMFGFTVEYDMYIHAHQDYNGGVTFTCGNTPSPIDFYVPASGLPTTYVGNCAGFQSLNHSGLSIGTWHNIAYSYSGGASPIRIYFDGVLVASHTGFGYNPAYSNGVFRIGDRMDLATNANAKFDNLRIWNAGRSGAQILADMTTCFTGNEPNLEIMYTMEEGSGTVLNDLAPLGGNQNGSIVGSFAWNSGSGSPAISNPIQLETGCQSYYWPLNSSTYTNSGLYNVSTVNSLGCTVNNTLELILSATAPDQTSYASGDSICYGYSVDISLATSEPGFNYTLVDNLSNPIAGPSYGNGDSIVFNTGPIYNNNTYSIRTESNYNGSLSFDGVDNEIIVNTSSMTISGSFTIEAWVKANTNAPGSTISIAGTRGPAEFSFDFKLMDGNKVHGDIGSGGSWISTSANGTLNYNTGQWYHIAFVVSPTGYTIYADGNIIGSGSYSGTPLLFDPTHLLTIGNAGSNITTENFDGSIDEVRIWNTARTQTQIQNHSNIELSGTESGLVCYYKFNEGWGNQTMDQTANNFNGLTENMDTASCWQFDVPFANSPCSFYLTDNHDVIVKPTYIINQTVEVCDSYTWNSTTLNTSGTYTQNFTNITGCDSTVNLNLIVNKVMNSYSISDDTICYGDTTLLIVNPTITSPTYVGNISSIDVNDAQNYPCIYGNYYEGAKHQILILGSELTALGMAPGNINGIQFFVDNVNALTDSLLGFSIKMAPTSVTSLGTTFETPSFTNCYSSTYFKVENGSMSHIFTTPFVWDGISNILIETCYTNDDLNYQENPSMFFTTTPFTSVSYYRQDDSPGICAEPTATATSSDRPNFRLLGNTVNHTSVWSNPSGGILNPTSDITQAVPNASGEYIIQVINTESGCMDQDTTEVWYGHPIVNLGSDIVQPNPPVVLDAGSGFSSYSWSNSVITQTTSINANGIYSVTVFDDLGCMDSDSIQVNFTASIPNVDGTNATASFYPNPTQGILNMQLDGFTDSKLNIEFIDVNGRVVKSFILENVTSNYYTTFDLNEMAEGTYFVKISSTITGIFKQIMVVK